jgi:hypothetical protein
MGYGPLYPEPEHPNFWLCDNCEAHSKPITREWPMAEISCEQPVKKLGWFRKLMLML